MLLSEISRKLTPLYRGLWGRKHEVGEIVNLTVRTDRVPLTSGVLASAVFNYGIELTLGITDLRKTCLYASTSMRAAQSYGMLTQLRLPATATIVYNPRRADSYTITTSDPENPARTLGKQCDVLAARLTSIWAKAHPTEDEYELYEEYIEDAYLSKTAKQLIDDFINVCTTDQSSRQRYHQAFEAIARKMVVGYRSINYGELPASVARDGIEVAIINVKTVQAEVLPWVPRQ